MPVEWTKAAGLTVALAVGLAVLLSRRRAIGQTTLVSAWWWTLGALTCWHGLEIAAALGLVDRGWRGPLRLAAAALSFCPLMALIGAKRPQHRAWDFVVASLWAILALPAAEGYFLHRGPRVEVGEIRSWFLWVLILLGPVNFLPTRYWLGSLLLAASQLAVFAPSLALVRRPIFPQAETIGALLSVAALAAAWLASCQTTPAMHRMNRLWLDFRDTFGLFWALRVQERINAAAQQRGWNLELGWSGFCARRAAARLDDVERSTESELRTVFKGLLRRFVSTRWIAERLAAGREEELRA